METYYTSYTKMVQNKSHYFVKKYLSFPEYKDVADILEGYGMHTDFSKACSIAGINDLKVREQILNELEANIPQAKVIELNKSDISTVKLMVK